MPLLRRFALVTGALLAACSEEQPCDLGQSIACTCSTGDEGSQTSECPESWQIAITDGCISGRGAMAVAPDGSVLFGGGMSDEFSVGGESFDSPGGYLLKISASGDLEWFQQLPGAVYVRNAAVGDDGSIAAVGYFIDETDFGLGGPVTAQGKVGFLWALDGDGTPLWVELLDGPDSGAELTEVVVSNDGDIFVTGNGTGVLAFGGEEMQLASSVVVGLSPTGETLWHDASLGGVLGVYGPRMTVDTMGRAILFADCSISPFDFGDGPSSCDGFVLRYELDGSRGPLLTYDAPTIPGDGVGGHSISALPNGGVRIVRPGYAASIDFGGGDIGPHGTFVVDLDENLEHVSSLGIGRDGAPQLVSHALAPNGSMVFGGQFTGQDIDIAGMTLSGDHAGILVRADASAAPVDAGLFGSPLNGVSFNRVAFDSSGSLVVFGSYSGEPDLGLGPLPDAACTSYFVARLSE